MCDLQLMNFETIACCSHLNKTTTYEDPRKDWSEEPPQPREVTLIRHAELGFGFVAGSEKPVIVR